MNKQELTATHKDYDTFYDEWQRTLSCYQGTDALIRWGAILKHPRESNDNFEKRKREAYSFNFSKAIIKIFTQYLFQKDAKREYPQSLGSDPEFLSFQDDCDLMGTSFKTFLVDNSVYASILGHVGIFVDKAKESYVTKAEEKQDKVYPYLSVYLPFSILNWKYERNPATGRPELTMLKLLDDDNRYRIWTQSTWEIWELKSNTDEAVLVDSGINNLGEIPFLWLFNDKGLKRNIGVSDISDISRIDISIMQNLLDGEEVIEYAAFPMFRTPRLPPSEDGTTQLVGVKAICEFDAAIPESKPDWLEAKVLEPITAILNWIDRKIQEIYRLAHASSITGVKEAQSGVALRYEFMEINSKLTAKANNLQEAELNILYFWLLWQDMKDLYQDISIERPADFSLEDLETDLQNIITAKNIIRSETFQKLVQKTVARRVMPNVSTDVMATIDKEIDSTSQADMAIQNFGNYLNQNQGNIQNGQ